MRHKEITLSYVHIPYNWVYADSTARAADTTVTSADLGKFARQSSDDSIWMLTATTPTWVSVSSSGGTVTAGGGSLTANAVVLGAGTTDTKVVVGVTSDGTSRLQLGVAGSTVGGVELRNATSGTMSIVPPTGALGTTVLTGLAASDTIAGIAATQTLTNKTLTAPVIATIVSGAGTNTLPTTTGTLFGSATKADVLQAAEFAQDAVGTDSYAITLSPAITAYVTGALYRFKAGTANTGACTIAINGLAATTIKKAAGGITTDLADNDIRSGQWVEVVYDGTNMQMLSILGNAAAAGSGTKTLMRWNAQDNQPPASAYATFNTRNSIGVLEFDAATAEDAVFVGIVPEAADFTTGISVFLHWMGATATSGNTIWTTAFERSNTDLDADSFATGINSSASAASGTSGIITKLQNDHSGSEIDGMTAGDLFRLKVTRKAADASDTMTGDAQLVAVEIRQR